MSDFICEKIPPYVSVCGMYISPLNVASRVPRASIDPKAKMYDSEMAVPWAIRAWIIGAADEMRPVPRFSTHTVLVILCPSWPPIMNTFPACRTERMELLLPWPHKHAFLKYNKRTFEIFISGEIPEGQGV